MRNFFTVRAARCLLLCLPLVWTALPAQAFKIETHVWLADQLAGEIIENNGSLEIDGRLYRLNGALYNAIKQDRGAFVMGTLGADVYPDLLAGQMTTHPGVNPAGGTSAWQTDDWLAHVVQSAMDSGRPSDLAFAAGYVLHAAMDTWAHSYVNLYTGDLFMIVENSETAERHVALENYIKNFHVNLRDRYPSSTFSDRYSQMRAPADFVRRTLILNEDAAREYEHDPSTLTAYYSAMYRYWRAALDARGNATALAEAIAAELARIDPLLNQLPALKSQLDAKQADFDSHLIRLANGAQSVLSGISDILDSTGIEQALAANGIQVQLDAPARVASQALDQAVNAYKQVTNAIGYAVEGFYDPDVIRATLRGGLQLAADGVVGKWPADIERAVDAWVVAWEDTAKAIMRPHGVPGRDPLGPLARWTQCWGPVILPVPVPSLLPEGCSQTLSTLNRVQTQVGITRDNLIDMLPLGHSVRVAMESLNSAIMNSAASHATSALNAVGQAIPSGALVGIHSALPPDPTGLATWLVRMWDQDVSAADLDQAFAVSSAPGYIERRVSPALHRELGICQNPNVKAVSYRDAPFANFAPIQNAMMMSKLALLDAQRLNDLISFYTNARMNDKSARSNQPGLTVQRDPRLQAGPRYQSNGIMGVALIGAIRSIDGDHQWQAVAPPLPRQGQQIDEFDRTCRRYGYPLGNQYPGSCAEGLPAHRLQKKTGFLLYHPALREAVFARLFQRIAPELCNFAGYAHPGAACHAAVDFPEYQPAPGQNRRLATRAGVTSFNRSKAAQVSVKPVASRAELSRAQTLKPAGGDLGKLKGSPARPPARDTQVKRPARDTQAKGNVFLGFNAGAQTPDWRNAYLLSLASYVSYPGVVSPASAPVDRNRLFAELRRWGLNPVAWIDKTTHGLGSGSTQFFAATTDDALVIAFRGSTISLQDLGQDWLDNDLDMNPRPLAAWGRGVVLHDGFFDAAAITFPEVSAIIQQHGQGRKLWLTGHSLGGAVALLTAMHVEKMLKRPVDGVYVYGAPPVGNAAWQAAYEAAVPNTHRWTLENDPVPVIMTQLPGTPFRHVGQRHNLFEGKTQLSDSREMSYSAVRGAGFLLTDLTDTHLGYWCRLNTEAVQHGENGLPAPPGVTCGLCDW